MKPVEELLSDLRSRNVKLWLEGDRLRYRAPEGSLSIEDLAEMRERKDEIIAFLKTIEQFSNTKKPRLAPVPREGNLPLSFAQQRFWFLYQFEPDSPANNMPVVVRFTGTLDLAILKRSLDQITQRHETLRSSFPVIDGQPVVAIAPHLELELAIVDLQEIPDDQREAEAHRLATESARQPFDLEQGPLLRTTLFRLAEQSHLLLWNMPCIICDGTSSDLFYRELTTIYRSLSLGEPLILPELPIQYVDFAHWQRQCLQGEVLEIHLAYWKQQLGGYLPPLELPTDYPRPSGLQSYRGDRYARMLPKSLHQALLNLSQQLGTTLFVVLLSAFNVLLYRHSQQRELLTSFVSSGRNQVETENVIGFFSNALILRTHLAEQLTFRQLVQRIHRTNLDGYAHQDLPFERLVDELRPEQRNTRSSLFQVRFTLNPPWTNGRGMAIVTLPNLKIESLFGYIYHGKTKFDLALVTREQDQGLGAVFDYNAELFTAATIERMMGHFQTLLEGIVADPNQRVRTLPLLTAEENRRLRQWNQVNYPNNLTIHQCFEAQAEATPDVIALICGNQHLTYRELDQQANQLAHYLTATGLGADAPIAVCLSRSVQSIVALLAILKTGSSYLPLDPLESSERLGHLLNLAQVELVLAETTTLEKLIDFSKKILCWEEIVPMLLTMSMQCLDSPLKRPACVLYTGVSENFEAFVLSHQSIIQQAKASAHLDLTSDQIFLHRSSLASEVTLLEVWGSLLNGAKLIIAPSITTSVEQLGSLISQYQVTTLWVPVRVFHRLVDTQLEHLSSLQQVLTGGDILSVFQAETFLNKRPARRLIYLYTSPINAGAICAYPVTDLAQLNTAIPIGYPVTNTQVYILDEQHQLLPIGVLGELCVGGLGLAQLDWATDTSNKRLIPDSFNNSGNAHLYRTGILARRLPDGAIEYIGQRDQQISIRGWRIELGRIETYLSQHPMVQEAVVLSHTDHNDELCLVAYVVCKPNVSISEADLRNDLKQKLPTISLPSRFLFISEIPLTPAGTIDYRSLSDSQLSLHTGLTVPIEARNELEQQLTEIWQQLFKLQSIDLYDNFFDLGGDSLLAVRLFSQLEAVCGVKLPLSVLLQAPTIALLAHLLRQDDIEEVWSPLVLIQAGNKTKPPLFCIHGGGFNVLVYRELAMQLDSSQPVYGLQARGLDGIDIPIRDRLEDMAADYIQQIRTVQPKGPYYLSGLSNGGNIALEMAQQLIAQGEEIALLGLFDSYGPNGVRLLAPLPRFLSSLHYSWRYSLPRYLDKLKHKAVKVTLKDLKALVASQQPEHPELNVRQPITSHGKPSNQSVATSANFLERRLDAVSQYILDHSPWAFFTPKEALSYVEGSTSETLKQLEDRYQKSYKNYVPKPYLGKIVLFRAEETPPGYMLDPYLGWQAIALHGVDVYKIPGHHTSLIGSPVLAKRVQDYIARASSNKEAIMKAQ